MPRDLIFRCKFCAREKQQSNHWFVIYEGVVGFWIVDWKTANAGGELDRDPDPEKPVEFVCSQACGHSLLDKFFAEAMGEAKKPVDNLLT